MWVDALQEDVHYPEDPLKPALVATRSITRVESQHAPGKQECTMTEEKVTYTPNKNPKTTCGSGFQNYLAKEGGI